MLNLYIYFYIMLMLSVFFYNVGLYLYYMDISIMFEWLMFSYNSLNMEMMILLDWIMMIFFSIIMLISSMIMLYMSVYMNHDKNILRFINLVNLFIFSMILMIMSPNLISILFGWDGLGLSSYCLVIYYQNYISYNSGMITVLSNRLGDIGLLMSISLMFMYMYGSWGVFFHMSEWLIMIMILIGALSKSAQIPFSVWLPLAMAAPTPVSALVHSSTLVTAGVYLLFRFNSILENFKYINLLLLYISVFTMFMSGLMANFEMDLKKIIALSTLSQLGLMMMALSLNLKFLALYHLFTHALFKSLLFMCAGVMIHFLSDNQDIRFYGKLNEFMPFTMLSFYISSLALMGFPFLAGFYSKDLIMEMVFMMNFNFFILIFICFSLMLTVSYSLRLMYYIFFNNLKISLISIMEDMLMNISMIILLMMSIMGGSCFFWICFFDGYFIYINLNMKLLLFMFMFLGILFMFMLYMKNLMKIYMIIYFFSSMWMLNYMFMWIYKPFNEMGIMGLKMEVEWFEFYQKNIILNFINKYKLNNNLYKFYMFMFVISMNLLMLFLLM